MAVILQVPVGKVWSPLHIHIPGLNLLPAIPSWQKKMILSCGIPTKILTKCSFGADDCILAWGGGVDTRVPDFQHFRAAEIFASFAMEASAATGRNGPVGRSGHSPKNYPPGNDHLFLPTCQKFVPPNQIMIKMVEIWRLLFKITPYQ